MIQTAILIDGSFILKRLPKIDSDVVMGDANAVADKIRRIALRHIEKQNHKGRREGEPDSFLYRIFFYDCPPQEKKVHYPISKRACDFSKSETAKFRTALHDALRKQRKMALRLGHIADSLDSWIIKPEKMKELLTGKKTVQELRDEDFTYPFRQKGVDMRIGLDIASLAFKKQVGKIILIAGDADFVPAAKLARREGIDFILDPMWSRIHPHLNEHIDGLQSVYPNPNSKLADTCIQPASANLPGDQEHVGG